MMWGKGVRGHKKKKDKKHINRTTLSVLVICFAEGCVEGELARAGHIFVTVKRCAKDGQTVCLMATK